MPLAAIDYHQVGPLPPVPIRVLLHGAIETAGQHFTHHGIVVARACAFLFLGDFHRGLDVELAVGVFHEAVRSGDDHATDRISPAGMAVVINLDPLQLSVETEFLRQAVQQASLRRAFRHAPAERFPRVVQRMGDQLALPTPLGHQNRHPPVGANGEGFRQQIGFVRFNIDQDFLRRHAAVIKLTEEGRQNRRRFLILIMAWKIRPRTVVPPSAEEKHLNAGLPAFRLKGDDIGIADAFDIDILMRLYRGHRPDPVAQGGCAFEIQRLRRRLHLGGKVLLHRLAVAGQEAFRLIDRGRIVQFRYLAHTRRAAALDLILQTGAGPG